MPSKPKPSSTKTQAERLMLEAQAEKFRAEARKATADAGYAELRLEELEEKRQSQLADDDYHHVYRFSESVGAVTVGQCMKMLTEWSRIDPECDIEIIFTSPGGSVLHGWALFDFLRSLSRAGHKVTATVLGYAASMAGILIQAGDHRRIGRESQFHIHEISTLAFGKISEIDDEQEFCKRMMRRAEEIFVERSNGKLTVKKLRNLYERREAWFDAPTALKYGLVDEIV